MSVQRIAIFAGGTGGHVYPALAVASELMQRGYHVEWFGTRRGLEFRVVPEAGYPLHLLEVSGIRGKGLLATLQGFLRVGLALLQALSILRNMRPVCALGMGGYVAGPAGLAAWLLRVPLVIHEQNSVAGTTNRLLRKRAAAVLVAYPEAFGDATVVREVGNPVRADLLLHPAEYDYDGRRELRLLVMGGSLGAQAINEVLPEALSLLPRELRLVVKHQTGPSHADRVRASYPASLQTQVEVLPFIEDMAAVYRWADLVLCRAGALTVAELAVTGRPAILVPLPHAIDNHQAGNAAWLADQGAARVLPQAEMTAAVVAGLLAELATAADQLVTMAVAARRVARPRAAERVADVCEEVRRDG
ncbi:MAG: undecaprenyldiphospho-muramoylpentapeptide beta-N-acetylglucosaminyltransferase [Halieaceae bacterium]|jgi:UDP-N-acetylglucosamine--N-acetylmuramyl-(pentapeptide) pyrophosphoryl-undecaprenol N-acetylglucosamine transferase|nr:undecaprenyldiphospho-muramoylpentapeptide beta-N-acetylglucosaminyltransferase [Halieaceae bacterium]